MNPKLRKMLTRMKGAWWAVLLLPIFVGAYAIGGKLRAAPSATQKVPDVAAAREWIEPVGPSKGPEAALVTIVVFTEPECKYCHKGARSLEAIREKYSDSVRVVIRHLPRVNNQRAQEGTRTFLAASKQGKFWELYAEWSRPVENIEIDYRAMLTRAGVDLVRLAADRSNPAIDEQLKQDRTLADTLKVRGTPTYFINGRRMLGNTSRTAWERIVLEEISEAKKLIAQGVAKERVYSALIRPGA